MKCVQITSKEQPKEWITKVKIRASRKTVEKECLAVFDTGAHDTLITKELFDNIKADITGQAINCTPAGQEIVCTTAIDITFGNSILKDIETIIVAHNMDCDILLGMNVITLGDFHSFRDFDGLYKCTFSLND